MDNFNKRKVKYISIPEDDILDMLRGESLKNIIKFKTLAEGYETLAVHPDWNTKAFNFLVYHKSFPVVPEGAQIPSIEGIWYSLKEYCSTEDCSKKEVE